MASWGDIAVGESRHSFRGPTKAAVMGLVAAALGIKREEEAQHLALNRSYAMATAVLAQGQLLRDSHTVQAPDSVGKFRDRTRRDELSIGKSRLGTVLSSREYRTDALAWVALRASDDMPYSLQQLADALAEPVFLLYLGRKSCPLGAPLNAQLIAAKDIQQAFSRYQPRSLCAPDRGMAASAMDERYLSQGHAVEYYWEGEVDDFTDPENLDRAQVMTSTQHDQLLSRIRWQFAARQVHRYQSMEGA
jgi:CRISPR system Cascade subunit CasD